MHGLLSANSAIKPILGRMGGDDNEAYADMAFGGITEERSVANETEFDKG